MDHYVLVKYQCRNGYEWDLIATVREQVDRAILANPPSAVAGGGTTGLPAGACAPLTAVELSERTTAELHSSRHREHVLRGFVLLHESAVASGHSQHLVRPIESGLQCRQLYT